VELFACRRPFGHPRLMVYRRFADVDEALRYAVEEIPRDALPSAVIQVNETRMNYKEIRKLYKERNEGNRRQARCRRRRRPDKASPA
jgi:hypothetical protein